MLLQGKKIFKLTTEFFFQLFSLTLHRKIMSQYGFTVFVVAHTGGPC